MISHISIYPVHVLFAILEIDTKYLNKSKENNVIKLQKDLVMKCSHLNVELTKYMLMPFVKLRARNELICCGWINNMLQS